MAKTGIPTLYRGVQYRSRLEARWAAFFDLLGWPFQYEPFDLDGWIPDFLLTGPFPVLVEVKPVTTLPASVATEMEQAGAPADHELMIVGCTAPVDGRGIECSDGLPIGWLRANPPVWRPDLQPAWGRAVVQHFLDELPPLPPEDAGFGLWHEHDARMRCDRGHTGERSSIHHNRISSTGRDLVWWGVYAPGIDDLPSGIRPEKNLIRDLWNRAGNAVQWRGKRAEATW